MKIQKRKIDKKAVCNARVLNDITEERFVELQSEAYYKAIKRIEDEKNNVANTIDERKFSILENLKLVGYMVFRPKKVMDKYGLKDGVTNSIFAVISSLVMGAIGKVIRFIAVLIIATVVGLSFVNKSFIPWITVAFFGVHCYCYDGFFVFVIR